MASLHLGDAQCTVLPGVVLFSAGVALGEQLHQEHRNQRTKKIRIQLDEPGSGGVRAYVIGASFDSVEALEAKMVQFPRGTAFEVFTGIEPPKGDQAPARKAQRAWAKERGVYAGRAAAHAALGHVTALSRGGLIQQVREKFLSTRMGVEPRFEPLDLGKV